MIFVAFVRCGISDVGKLTPLTLGASAIVCRMAGDSTSHNWFDCVLNVSLSIMKSIGYQRVSVTISKSSYTTSGSTSFSVFGIPMGLGTKVINLADGTSDNIGGRYYNMRGYSSQDGFQEIINITAVFE